MSVKITEHISSYQQTVSGQKAQELQETKTQEQKVDQEAAAVYEKSETSDKEATYKVNQMSKEDRASLVEQLKSDQESRQQSLIDLVQKMISKQADTFGAAFGDSEDAVWKFLAKGDFTVDEETREKARQDIAEDGYYGVKQTSERLFDFASALAGDDVDKMKEMQDAMLKGYELAEKTWGGELPEISRKTLEAANQLFDDYYAAKNTEDLA